MAVLYRLVFEQRPNRSAVLRLGHLWRVFFGVVSVAVALLIAQPGRSGPILPVIGVIAAGGALYVESWRFDRASDTVRARTGVLGLTRLRVYRLSTLRRIVIRVRSAPIPAGVARVVPQALLRRGYVQVLLEFVNDDEAEREAEPPQRVVVQTESLRGRAHLHTLAKQLADTLSVPLHAPGP